MEAEEMEYTATAAVKQAMERAHEERGRAMRAFWARLFAPRRAGVLQTGISRWA
ncbi:hypothetical protein MACH18_27740 [Phaeobacter italicus]|jgi:hypothetical protein|nr:hypothetical protein MACH18_27740 [Phaeobacter italicus]